MISKAKVIAIFFIIFVDAFLFLNFDNVCGEGFNLSSLLVILFQFFIFAVIAYPEQIHRIIEGMTTESKSFEENKLEIYIIIFLLSLWSFQMLYEEIRGTITIAGSEYCSPEGWISKPIKPNEN